MNQPYSHEPDVDIDPEIVKLLEPLRAVPERTPRQVDEGRARFLKQLDVLEIPQVQISPDGKFLHRLFKRRTKPEEPPMNAPRFAFSAFLAIVLIVLFGGVTTVYASQSALPGDVLYPVKTTFEQTQASLAADAVRRADLYLEFAGHRLDEAERLIEQGRFDSIEAITGDFEHYVRQALQELQTVSAGDPARAAELSRRVIETLARYNQALSGMVDRVPATVRERVQNAIRVSNPPVTAGEVEITGTVEVISGSSWTVSGTVIAVNTQTQIKGSILPGDLVNVHAYTAADGTLTAREIEKFAPGRSGSAQPTAQGYGTPHHTHTPQPIGTHTPGAGEQHQERSGTQTPGTGDHDQERDQERDQDRLHTQTPVPGDGTGSQDGDGNQNGSGSGENCGDCPGDGRGTTDSGGQNDGSGSGSIDSGGQSDGSGSGEHDGSGGEHDGGSDHGGGGRN